MYIAHSIHIHTYSLFFRMYYLMVNKVDNTQKIAPTNNTSSGQYELCPFIGSVRSTAFIEPEMMNLSDEASVPSMQRYRTSSLILSIDMQLCRSSRHAGEIAKRGSIDSTSA